MGWCDRSLPGGDAVEQQAGQLEGGGEKGRWVIIGKDENSSRNISETRVILVALRNTAYQMAPK